MPIPAVSSSAPRDGRSSSALNPLWKSQMPDEQITFNPADAELLERVRQQQGLETIALAAEWLAKRRNRRLALRANGRGRALYLVGKERK